MMCYLADAKISKKQNKNEITRFDELKMYMTVYRPRSDEKFISLFVPAVCSV
jgi:hypothetical protein